MNPREDHADKTASKFLKLAGGTVLLFSAIVQNFVYDALSSRYDSLSDAIHDQALIDKGGLIHQADYYILSASPGKDSVRDQFAAEHLRLFAEKLYQSQVVAVAASSGFDKDDKSNYLSTLGTLGSQVHDYQSALQFTQYINSSGAKYSESLDREFQTLIPEKTTARLVFLVLYVIGALIALGGPFLDWRHARGISLPRSGRDSKKRASK